MAKDFLTVELWERTSLSFYSLCLIPKAGRLTVPDRLSLTAILFIARTGTVWELFPPELGCGSRMNCWRRLRDRQVAGVWQKVWKALFDELGLADKMGWSNVVVDRSSARVLFGGRKLAPIPRIAAKKSRKSISLATTKSGKRKT